MTTALPFVSALFLALVWALSHPYEGLIHDAILYAGQALRHLRPDVFGADFFFGNTSQDDYTVFGRGYAFVAGRLGLAFAGASLFALAQIGWLAVSLAWIRTSAPHLALAGVACLLALRYPYAVDGRLEVAESFTTARLLAEPIALFGLLCALRGRHVAAIGAIAVAFVVHPLVALPAVAVAVAVRLSRNFSWRTIVAVACSVIALCGIVAAVLPERVDDAWLQLIEMRSGFAVPSGWTLDGVARWAAVILMLLISASFVSDGFARMLRAVALVAAAGVALSVLAQLLRSAPLMQLQAWRAMWLATWFAPLAVLSAVVSIPAKERALRLRMLAIVPAFALAQFSWLPGLGLVVFLYSVVLGSVVFLRPDLARQGRSGPALAACVAFAGLASIAGGRELAAFASVAGAGDPPDRLLLTLAIRHYGWLAAAGLAWLACRGATATARTRLVTLCILLAGLSVAVVDARPPVARNAQLLGVAAIEAWRRIVPEAAQVFWSDRQRYVWFGLGRASYVSSVQGAGVVFDRATALEAYRRRSVIEPLSLRDGAFTHAPVPWTVAEPRHGVDDLARACSADRRLDFVVLDADLPASIGEPYVEPFSGRAYRLYACANYR